MRLILFITALSAAGCHQAGGEFRIQPIAPLAQDAVQWETVTLQFELPGGTGNPFDPADFDVHLNVTGPNGQQWQHPAFFTTDHQIVVSHGREAVRNMKKSHWEVRWTPSEAGNYAWSLSAANGSQRASMSGQVTCRQGQHSGFVRVAKRDSNWFETSDGTFFYPIGHVTRSPEDVRWNALSGHHPQAAANSGTRIHADKRSRAGAFKTAKYETWFRRMRDNGENICAVWMSPWSLGLEWSPTHPGYAGVGYYNQIHAAQLDRIFELAERYRIRILLFTMNHGRLSTVIDREWYQHPYRRVDAQGFVDSPADYFSSAECLRLEQNRLRYILARWGHSTSLFGLGLCTEVNWVDPYHGLEAPADAELRVGE